jgi:hypothetical protein
MNTISHILQLWRFYWRTEKKTYLRIFLIIFAIYLVKTATIDFIFLRTNFDVYITSHYTVTQWIYWLSICIVFSYLFDAIHHKQRAIDFLCLPASKGEKFLAHLIWGCVGIPLIATLACIAEALVVTLFVGAMDILSGHQVEWKNVFDYFCVSPTGYKMTDYIMGILSFKWYFFNISIFDGMLAMVFYTLFIWAGTAFRRAGWVYAIIAVFVVTAVIMLIYEVAGLKDMPFIHEKTFKSCMLYTFDALSILFTYLAYRSFCRAQIVTHKFVTL